MNKRLFIFLLVLITLPIVLVNQKQIQQFITRATYKPANIIIETKNTLGPINNSWAAFAQGGEEAPANLSPVVSKMKELSPRYIRLDHIYDANNVVSNKGNEFVYDFSTLDKVVKDIINMGALPFFSLSYMPRDFTSSGSLIDLPGDWNNWKNLVKATIEHYSGKNNLNLTDVYYEVWNEPELPQFGGWKLGSDKDYRLLYFYAAQGAKEAENVNQFYFGGPSVGSFYSDWVNNFVSYVAQNNLRLDFYSWHRYTKRPHEYANDARKIRNLLANFPSYANIPLLLTEWGIDSENNDINNTNTAAAYTIYAVSEFNRDIQYAFNFEVKDGPPPTGGRWGLFTHEINPEKPLTPKPKFNAFSYLAKLSGDQLLLTGDGTHVTGLASATPTKISAILTNYDASGRNIENVPVTFSGLKPAMYSLNYNYVLDDRSGFYEIPVTNGNVSKNFLLPANSIIFLELNKISPLATFIPGPSTLSSDRALILNSTDGSLSIGFPEFNLQPVGSISFDIKPFWDNLDNRSFFIFEAPFSTTEGIPDKLSLIKQKTDQGNKLVLSVSQGKKIYEVSLPSDKWEKDTWHHIDTSWSQNGLTLTVDKAKTQQLTTLNIRNGKSLSFSPIDAAFDNIKIVIGKDQIIERHFDAGVDK